MHITLRMITMVVLGAAMTLTPFYRQVLGGKGAMFPQWRMFSVIYVQQCEVAFFERRDGHDVRIDRLAVLGLEPWYEAPRDTLFLKTGAAVRAQARELCRHLDVDLRADARCGTMDGWTLLMAREDNLCAHGGAP